MENNMKRLILFIILIITCLNLYSEELPFKVERMICDFRGACSLGNTVIAYGDYGIICGSSDNGNTWWQKSLGDKYQIQKIVLHENVFYGVTQFSLIKSLDSGKTWIHKQFSINPEIQNLTIGNSKLFFQTKTGIYEADLDLNYNSKSLVSLDSNKRFTELTYNKSSLLMIIDSVDIFRFNIDTKLEEFFSYDDKINKDCRNACYLKMKNDTLYLLRLNNKYTKANIMVYSVDNGQKWNILKDSLKAVTYYNILNDGFIYCAIDTKIDFNYIVEILKLNFYKYDCKKFEQLNIIDTLNYKILYDINFDNQIKISEIIKLSDSCLLTFGTNKLILKSDNNGKSWNIISYFDEEIFNSDLNNCLKHIDNKHVLISKKYKNISIDGGITWIPSLMMVDIYGKIMCFDYDKNGNGGFVRFERKDSSIVFYKANKYGLEYSVGYKNKLNRELLFNNEQMFKFNDCSIFTIHRLIQNQSNDTIDGNKFTDIYYFDSNNEFINVKRFDSTNIYSITKFSDNNLYAISVEYSGYYVENGYPKYRYTRRYLIKSTDYGANWTKIQEFNKEYKFTTHSSLFKLNNLIFLRTWSIDSNAYMCIVFDLEKNTQQFIKDRSNFVNESINSNGKIFYGVANDNSIGMTSSNNLFSNEYKYYSPRQFFSNWDNCNFANQEYGEDWILYFQFNADYGGMLTSKIIVKDRYSNKFPINYCRIIDINPTEVEKEEIEIEKSYLYNTEAYPIPAKNNVRSKIYWEPRYPMDENNISIFDVNGNKVIVKSLELQKNEIYSGIINIDCSNLSNGTYIIIVKSNDNKLVIPFIIAK